MSKILILAIGVCTIFGCATKRKNTTTKFVSENKKTSSELSANKQQTQLGHHLSVDSSSNKISLKIYPKNSFYINKGGFTGYADSLIWIGEMSKVNRKHNFKFLVENENVDQTLTDSSSASKKDTLTMLSRKSYFWWIIVASLLLMMALRYVWKKISRFHI